MMVVLLQHQCLICETVNRVAGGTFNYGGGSENNTGVVRTKESGNIWDDEW